MKANDIIDLLPIVADRGWTIAKDGWVRDRNGRCPICSLANAVDVNALHRNGAQFALRYLGLDVYDPETEVAIGVIVNAADGTNGPFRRSMLAALGLA